jgi:excinuclease UvrABC nuclease subunit
MAAHIDLPGVSGNTYRYFFLSSIAAPDVKKEAGNYLFAKPLGNGKVQILYIGQADDLSRRLSTHDRWEEAKRLGATQVYAHTKQGGEAARCAEEKDLIQRWNPPLNTQHRKTG